MRTPEDKVYEIMHKYRIDIDDSGDVLFTNDKQQTLENMMMDYLGKSYQVGTYLYDTKKEDRTPEREEALKDISGEMNVLKTIMVNCNYEPLIGIFKIPR